MFRLDFIKELMTKKEKGDKLALNQPQKRVKKSIDHWFP